MNSQTLNNLTNKEADKKRDCNKLNTDEANAKYMKMKRGWENEFNIFFSKTEYLIYYSDFDLGEHYRTLIEMSEKIDAIRTDLFNRKERVLDILVS